VPSLVFSHLSRVACLLQGPQERDGVHGSSLPDDKWLVWSHSFLGFRYVEQEIQNRAPESGEGKEEDAGGAKEEVRG